MEDPKFILSKKTAVKQYNKLKKILPIGVIMVGASVVMGFFQNYKTPVFAKSMSLRVESDMVMEAAPRADIMPYPEPNFALWFLYGAVCTILLYLLFEFIRQKRKK